MKRLFQKSNLPLEKSDRRKIYLFFGSLIFSVCFWILFSLSKTYTYQVLALVRFKNAQVRKGLSLEPSKQVSLKIEGTGWQLFNSDRKASTLTLEANLAGQKWKSFIDLKEFISDFNTQIHAGQKILEINPDTIRYKYVHRQYKKVPLTYRYSVTFEKQFYFLDPVSGSPDSVTVSGPPSKLRHLLSWQTPKVAFKNLHFSVDTLLNLADPNYPDLNPEPTNVHMSVRVDQFTEKILKLPVHVLHAKDDESVILIPSMVQVYMLVPLSYYNTVRPELFDVVCDLQDWRFSRHSKLGLKVRHAPDFVRIEKLYPSDIDFLIHR